MRGASNVQQVINLSQKVHQKRGSFSDNYRRCFLRNVNEMKAEKKIKECLKLLESLQKQADELDENGLAQRLESITSDLSSIERQVVALKELKKDKKKK